MGATIVWDHCEGHLGAGREEEVAGWALRGLKEWFDYGFGEE